MARVTFHAGDTIFSQGDRGRSMFWIESGKAGVYAADGVGGEKKLTELNDGQLFGEMALIDVSSRSATVIAETDLVADEIDSAELTNYYRNEPEKVKTIAAHLLDRLHVLGDDYKDVCRTIYEMERTKKQRENRGEELLNKIKRFFGHAKLAEPELMEEESEPVDDPNVDLPTIEALEAIIREKPSEVPVMLRRLTGRLRTLTVAYLKACKTVEAMVQAEEEQRKLDAEFAALQAVYMAQAQMMGGWM